MEYHTFGKPDAAALLLIPDREQPWEALYRPLQPLEKDYFLILPQFDGPETVAERAALLADCLLTDFGGRIWGAYGLRQGGDVLLQLLSGGQVAIRTAVTEGARALPLGLTKTPGQLVCWAAAGDKAAGKAIKTLRGQLPALRTVKLKKLPADTAFMQLRPDLLVKRLKKTLGKARVVTVSSVMDRGADRLYTLMERAAGPEAPLLRDEKRRVLLREGGGKLVKRWSRLTRLEPISGTETICTEQVELSDGPLTGLAERITRRRLKKEKKSWDKVLYADKRKGWLD